MARDRDRDSVEVGEISKQLDSEKNLDIPGVRVGFGVGGGVGFGFGVGGGVSGRGGVLERGLSSSSKLTVSDAAIARMRRQGLSVVKEFAYSAMPLF